MKYVWLVEGEPYTGTMQNYAKAVEEGITHDLEVSKNVWFATREGKLQAIEPVRFTSYNDDGDLMTVWLNVGIDEGRYHMDMRT